jgi:nucleotide-binding universal stress UspA family protein
MYKRILLAYDGSDTAKLALEQAVRLAKDQQAQLRIATVVELMRYSLMTAGGYPFEPAQLWDALLEGGRKELEEAQANARSAGVEAETVLLEDKEPSQRVAGILVKEAQRWDADLIVLGTHGRRGFDRLFLGSVAETLMRMATTPVLLVRTKSGGMNAV